MGDLLQVASLGRVKAVDRWDPDRGSAFTAFATPTMLGELPHYSRDTTWAVRRPRQLQELARAIEGARVSGSLDIPAPRTGHAGDDRASRVWGRPWPRLVAARGRPARSDPSAGWRAAVGHRPIRAADRVRAAADRAALGPAVPSPHGLPAPARSAESAAERAATQTAGVPCLAGCRSHIRGVNMTRSARTGLLRIVAASAPAATVGTKSACSGACAAVWEGHQPEPCLGY